MEIQKIFIETAMRILKKNRFLPDVIYERFLILKNSDNDVPLTLLVKTITLI